MRNGLCLILVTLFNCHIVAGGAQPNVLILMANDLGWGDLGANGNRDVATPGLDALAESGLKFEKFYVCPNGSTTSASLLTGRYHYRTGVVGESGLEAMMHGTEKTLGEIFRENGYRAAWFGRWHHGDNWPHNPPGQGFPVFEESDPVPSTLNFIRQAGDSPFFCLVNFPDPGLVGAEKLSPPERLRRVHRGVARLDEEVRQILDALDATGRRRDTIVIFLSDNGPDQFGATEGRYNGYFYGGKGSVHEGGVRVPCFVSWPGKIEAGSRFLRISAHIDWYPTLAELCGLKSTGRSFPLDGSSLASVLLSGGDSGNWPNPLLFTSWTPPGYAVREGSYAVRTDRWLALRDARWRRPDLDLGNRSNWELYDLKTDPFESREKGAEFPFLVSDLKADFGFWIDDTTDDGIGPIPIQIGHPEWPVVTFRSNPEMAWPVRIVKPGAYEVKLEGAGECEMMVGGERRKVANGSILSLSEDIKTVKVISGNVSGWRLINPN